MAEKAKSKTASSLYLPGLNGIRAIASIAVLIAHLNHELVAHNANYILDMEMGRYAVSIFFTLSGFLITYLLLLEKQKTGTISIKKFYIRRILRIWPLYSAFLAVALLVGSSLGMEFMLPGLLLTVFFAPNIALMNGESPAFTQHYWSLGVEEQFYLFWPWLIRQSKNAGLAIGVFLIGFYLLKFGLRFGAGGFSFSYTLIHLARFDCMAMGGLAAWLMWKGIPKKIKDVLYHPITQTISWLFIIAILLEFVKLFTFVEHQAIALLSAIIILNVASNPNPVVSLEGKTWAFFGDISFGLYVWHPLLIMNIGNVIFSMDWPIQYQVTTFLATSIPVSILVSYLSLRFLERPFLKLKHKFALIATKRQKTG